MYEYYTVIILAHPMRMPCIYFDAPGSQKVTGNCKKTPQR